MKQNKLLSGFMLHRLKKALIITKFCTKEKSKLIYKKAKIITSKLISNVKDVSHKNPMSSNIQFAFPIIAIWLASDKKLTMEQVNQLITVALDSNFIRFIYSSKNFNDEKKTQAFMTKMKKRSEWHESHPEDSYGWKFEFDDNLHKEGCYYAFRFCPIADFCKTNGYEEIAPVLCNIDYATFSMCHGRLIRAKTLAKGDDLCDFWIVGDKNTTAGK